MAVTAFEEFAGTAIGVAVGNVLPFPPEWQANLGVGYIASLANGYTLTPRADLSYNDETFFDANNTDELYATGGNSSLTTGSGYAEIAYARPRE